MPPQGMPRVARVIIGAHEENTGPMLGFFLAPQQAGRVLGR